MWRFLLLLTLSPVACSYCGTDDKSTPERKQSKTETTATEFGRQSPRSDCELVLDAVLSDLLTNPELKSTRDFYGTPGDTKVALASDSGLPWPKEYQPIVSKYTFHYTVSAESGKHDSQRVLGIALNHFVFPPPKEGAPPDPLYQYPVAIGMFNAGGAANGGANGACLVYYSLERDHNRWKVVYEGKLRP